MDFLAEDQDKAMAGIEFLRRTGATQFSIRFQDDEEPTVWVAVVKYNLDGEDIYEAAGAIQPRRAIMRLCEMLADGGTCVHCKRPTGFEPDDITTMPVAELVCWYQYDPELKTYRRACEGDKK